MLICYCLKPEDGAGISLEYSDVMEDELMQDFIHHENVPSYEIIFVDARYAISGRDEYTAEDAYMDVARHYLRKLKKIVNEHNDGTITIEKEFLDYPAGANINSVLPFFSSIGAYLVKDLFTGVFDVLDEYEVKHEISVGKQLVGVNLPLYNWLFKYNPLA